MLEKIIYAGVQNPSFQQGSEDLRVLAELHVPEKQVERLTRRIGAERCAERDAEVASYQALPLVQKCAAPAGVTPPNLAVVMVDGGRLQILERTANPALPAVAERTTAETAEEDEHTGHWREDKIGLLLTMQSPVSATDPCPEIPEAFVDPTRILKLAREIKQGKLAPADAVAEVEEPEAAEEALAEAEAWEPPEVRERRTVASRTSWPLFGPLLARAAWTWGFAAAPRKAFVADGASSNWTLWRRFFSSHVPILDFIHALSYVFHAAMAGRKFAAGWQCYTAWIQAVWAGQVETVIAALAERQAELGTPSPGDGETSPRQVVAAALSYLQNHKDRMRYQEYRQQGLPITSSHVESTVKLFNRRVKGSEKFWSEPGAEGILQLRADYLSDDNPLPQFWQRRQEQATGQRCYRKAA